MNDDFKMIEFADGESFRIEEVNVETIRIEEVGARGRQGERGPQGIPGQSGAVAPIEQFSYGDAPTVVFTAPYDGYMVAVAVTLEIPFNGASPDVSFGTVGDPDLIMPAGLIDAGIAGIYEVSPFIYLAQDTEVLAFMFPGSGASQGSGFVRFEFVPIN